MNTTPTTATRQARNLLSNSTALSMTWLSIWPASNRTSKLLSALGTLRRSGGFFLSRRAVTSAITPSTFTQGASAIRYGVNNRLSRWRPWCDVANGVVMMPRLTSSKRSVLSGLTVGIPIPVTSVFRRGVLLR